MSDEINQMPDEINQRSHNITLWQSLMGATYFIGIGMVSLFGFQAYTGRANVNYIPRIEKVQKGFIAPSKLEIDVQNLDKSDDLPETVMRIGNKQYFLKEIEGKPVLQEFKIKPAEVILKE